MKSPKVRTQNGIRLYAAATNEAGGKKLTTHFCQNSIIWINQIEEEKMPATILVMKKMGSLKG